MTKDEEIRMINEKLDFYVMEASDEEFNTEEVRKLVKRLDELDPIPLPWKSDEEAAKRFKSRPVTLPSSMCSTALPHLSAPR